MIQRIKTWFANYKEKRRRKQILKDIKKAQHIFLNKEATFMCYCFRDVNREKYMSWSYIHEEIPEFRPQTFGLNIPTNGAWWPAKDRASRIKAFDKLIEIYSK